MTNHCKVNTLERHWAIFQPIPTYLINHLLMLGKKWSNAEAN